MERRRLRFQMLACALTAWALSNAALSSEKPEDGKDPESEQEKATGEATSSAAPRADRPPEVEYAGFDALIRSRRKIYRLDLSSINRKAPSEEKAPVPVLTKEEAEALKQFDAALAELGDEEFQRREAAIGKVVAIMQPVQSRIFDGFIMVKMPFVQSRRQNTKEEEQEPADDDSRVIVLGKEPSKRDNSETITIHVDGQPLCRILEYLSWSCDTEIKASTEELGARKITMNADDITVDECLQMLCIQNNLAPMRSSLDCKHLAILDKTWLQNRLRNAVDPPQPLGEEHSGKPGSQASKPILPLDAMMMQHLYDFAKSNEDYEAKIRLEKVFEALTLPPSLEPSPDPSLDPLPPAAAPEKKPTAAEAKE